MTMLQAVRPPAFDTADMALLGLLAELKAQHYHFVTATAATHARVIARRDRQRAASLRDILSWRLPFAPGVLDPAILAALEAGGMIDDGGSALRSEVRVSSSTAISIFIRPTRRPQMMPFSSGPTAIASPT